MLRSALSSRSLAVLAAGFLASQTVACTPSASNDGSGGSGSGSGGSGAGTGGKVGTGGSGAGTGGKVGSGGSGTATGGSGTATGGSGTATGGSGTATGGSGTATGGSGTATGGSGTATGGSGTATGGSGTATGGAGTGTGGAAGGSNGNPNCPTAGAGIISDFEEGTTGVTINPKGGVWYAYHGTVGTQTPGPVTASTTPTGIATATDGSGTCKGALHIVGMGLTDYSGFGATFAPAPTSANLSFSNAIDVSAHKGVSFKIKAGSGTPAAIYFDMKTKESAPMAEGGNLSDGKVGQTPSQNLDEHIGLRNNRGQMLLSPWTSPTISTTWQTITVPFGTLVPRWVPASGSNACPPPGAGVAKCQAPPFVAKDVLGIEFSVLDLSAFGIKQPSGASAGTYDIWIDDVAWVDDDSGLPTQPGFPLAGAGSVGMCSKPTGADGKYLVTAYNLWKQTFAKGGAGPVIRPEASNDVVSEGIAYGMLIAVNMNDKTTFDNLYSYWKGKKGAGSSTAGLMTWCQGSTGGGTGAACNAQGGGSATDADEDAAFALIQAGKVFGGTYAADAAGLISDIWSKDIDTSSNLPTGGSNYGNSTSSHVTNPSYFAPAYYRIFQTIDSGHNWNAVADKSIQVINSLGGGMGLVPAWCSGNCTAAASNGAATDTIYQYDSHRTPMRVGLDYCWNGTSSAQTYVKNTTTFFATSPFAGQAGIGRIYDMYLLNGTPMGAVTNSASLVGTAAVGAMAAKSNQAFLDDAYQAVFDATTRGNLAPATTGETPYSYYNATVGMLTLLIMTGNFSH